MKKTLAILGILVLLGGIFSACGAAKPQRLLAGKWKASVASLEFQAFEFVPSADSDLKGTVNIGMLSNLVHGSYEVIPGAGKDARDTVKITYTLAMFSNTRSYFFTVDGATLTLQREGSGTSLVYTRDTGAAAATTG